MPTVLYEKVLWAFVPTDAINKRRKFEVRSFVRSCNNRGTQKFWAVTGYAHVPF